MKSFHCLDILFLKYVACPNVFSNYNQQWVTIESLGLDGFFLDEWRSFNRKWVHGDIKLTKEEKLKSVQDAQNDTMKVNPKFQEYRKLSII